MTTDLRHALRLLLNQPSFTAAVVLTLGLGIGTSTAVYSIVDAVLLKPLPYPAAERIVMVSARRAMGGEFGVSGGLIEALAKLPSIEHAAAVSFTEQNLVSGGSLAIVTGAMVTNGFFDVFQTAPLLGRTPGSSPASGDEIVLAEPLWRERFAADPRIVGRSVRLDDRSFTVVGVMPRSFAHPEEASYWRSMTVTAGQRSQVGSGPYDGVARVARQGLQAARTEADVLSASLGMTTDGSPVTIAIAPLLETMTEVHRRTLMYALTAVGVVLLIACGNAAHLLLARTSGRARELAVRSALGAARFRLVRQLLTEAALIASVSCAAGVVIAALLMRLIPFIGMTEMPRLSEATLDARLLAFAGAVSTASVLLIGLVPAWLASRTGESLPTNRSTPPKTARRAAWVIVAGEAALTLMLLVGGGLAAVTLMRTLNVDLGFETSSLSLVTLRPTAKYVGATRSEYYDRVAGLVREAAGVESVAVVSHIPLGRFLAERVSVAVDGGAVVAEGRAGPRARTVGPGSFAALGVPILRGREFVAEDREGNPRVAVVNATLAARLWPGEDAVGKSVRAPAFTRPGTETYTVVGVVGDLRGSLASLPSPELYVSSLQRPVRTMYLVVRSRLGLSAIDTLVRDATGSVDAEQPATAAVPMSSLFWEATQYSRFRASLLSSFAILGLTLAAGGVLATVVRAVVARTRELSIRSAVGATPAQLVRLVMGDVLRPVTAGLVLGVVGSYNLSAIGGRFIAIDRFEFTVCAAATMMVALVAAAAAYVPARRAAHIDLIQALQQD